MGLFSHKAKFLTNVLSWGSSLPPKKFHKWIAKKKFLKKYDSCFLPGTGKYSWKLWSFSTQLMDSTISPNFSKLSALFIGRAAFPISEVPAVTLALLRSGDLNRGMTHCWWPVLWGTSFFLTLKVEEWAEQANHYKGGLGCAGPGLITGLKHHTLSPLSLQWGHLKLTSTL